MNSYHGPVCVGSRWQRNLSYENIDGLNGGLSSQHALAKLRTPGPTLGKHGIKLGIARRDVPAASFGRRSVTAANAVAARGPPFFMSRAVRRRFGEADDDASQQAKLSDC
jgi:hypothetical protein